jgi:hypothetical protein
VKWKGIVGQRFTPGEFHHYLTGLTFDAWKPKFIVVHNTQIPTLAQWAGRSSIVGLENYYRDNQKWSGGPHLFIEPGGIWVFTPLTVPGVHSPSWNNVAWGVEIVGDFDHETFGDDQKQNVLEALASMHARMGWLEPNIRLHKEDPKTTHTGCPGRNIVKVELEAGIQTLLDISK